MRYAYHATLVSLARLAKAGLTPGSSSRFEDRYSDYDDGEHLFFSDSCRYVLEGYAFDPGSFVLRFPWPDDAKPDRNIYGRVLPSQFASRKRVSAETIDVLVGERWLSLPDI